MHFGSTRAAALVRAGGGSAGGPQRPEVCRGTTKLRSVGSISREQWRDAKVRLTVLQMLPAPLEMPLPDLQVAHCR